VIRNHGRVIVAGVPDGHDHHEEVHE